MHGWMEVGGCFFCVELGIRKRMRGKIEDDVVFLVYVCLNSYIFR